MASQFLTKFPTVSKQNRSHVKDINKHLRGHQIRWLGHLGQMNVEHLIKRVQGKTIMENVNRGQSKKT